MKNIREKLKEPNISFYKPCSIRLAKGCPDLELNVSQTDKIKSTNTLSNIKCIKIKVITPKKTVFFWVRINF